MAMEKHFIQEGVIRSEVESYLRKELNRAGYSSLLIQKTPLATRITIHVEKPPLVIGRKGKRIQEITRLLRGKYRVENPEIDVQRIENPNLDPSILARRIAVALERGMNRRRVAYKAIRAVMSSKARGVEIVLSGKITGKGGRSRVEKYNEGYMKKAGDSLKLVDIGRTQANLKAGVIGVTVKIVPPGTVFPDQIEVKPKVDPVSETEDVKIQEAAEKKQVKKKSGEKETAEKKTIKKAKAKDKPVSSVKDIPGVGPKSVEKLESAGITTPGQLAKADAKDLAEKTGLSEKSITGWQKKASKNET